MKMKTSLVRKIINSLLRGFLVMLPILATIAIIFWLWGMFEGILGTPLKKILPEGWYYTGMGTVLCLILILLVGVFLETWLVKQIITWAEGMLDRTPLVKSIYGSLRDLVGFFKPNQEQKKAQVVLVQFPHMKLLGLLTQSNLQDSHPAFRDQDLVAVYLPISYGMGGYTILVPRSAIEPISMSVEDAMRFAITAGMSTGKVAPANGIAPQPSNLSNSIVPPISLTSSADTNSKSPPIQAG